MLYIYDPSFQPKCKYHVRKKFCKLSSLVILGHPLISNSEFHQSSTPIQHGALGRQVPAARCRPTPLPKRLPPSHQAPPPPLLPIHKQQKVRLIHLPGRIIKLLHLLIVTVGHRQTHEMNGGNQHHKLTPKSEVCETGSASQQQSLHGSPEIKVPSPQHAEMKKNQAPELPQARVAD